MLGSLRGQQSESDWNVRSQLRYNTPPRRRYLHFKRWKIFSQSSTSCRNSRSDKAGPMTSARLGSFLAPIRSRVFDNLKTNDTHQEITCKSPGRSR